MASAPQAMPQGGAPGGAPSGAPQPAGPAQPPASPEQVMLAKLYQACKQLAQTNPVMAPGLAKAAQGIQEAQSAMVSQPKPQSTGSTPPY